MLLKSHCNFSGVPFHEEGSGSGTNLLKNANIKSDEFTQTRKFDQFESNEREITLSV